MVTSLLTDLAADLAARLALAPPSVTAALSTDGADLPVTTAALAATLLLVPAAAAAEAPLPSPSRLMERADPRVVLPVLDLPLVTAARSTDGVDLPQATAVPVATVRLELVTRRMLLDAVLGVT